MNVLEEWTALVCFLGELIWFVTHRGAPEQLEITEDGRVRVIEPDAPLGTAPESDEADESDEPGEHDDDARVTSTGKTETEPKPERD